MELDELKATWNNIEAPGKTAEEIKTMLSENKHPVLKRILKQLTIEIIGWVAFLTCYYSMFDGADKPLLINGLLILAVTFPIIHNLTGYRFAKYLVLEHDIRLSLQNYLAKVKIYAVVSIATRVFFIGGLMLFFMYGIKFNTHKYILLALGVLVFIAQLIVLYRLWAKRLHTLTNTIAELN